MKPQRPSLTKLKFIEPMYARLVNELPEGNEWLYEVKLDGYRCLAGKGKHQVTLWSRRENLFTKQFPRIAQVCEGLKPDTLLDGEIVALDGNGRPSFNLLQHHRSKASAIHYYAFDLLIYRGKSLLSISLEQRRELLAEAVGNIASNDGPVRLSEVFTSDPVDLIAAAKDLGFEGIFAKARILFTKAASELAHGSSTRSTGGRSLSSAAIRQGIRLMR